MKWFHFILSHSIFISFCAVALCFQTYLLLHIPGDKNVYLLVFCSTLAGYNGYWLISKYYFTKVKLIGPFLKKNISNLFLLTIASCGVLLSLSNAPDLIPVVGVSVFLTLLYSLPLWPFRALTFLRKAGFFKTILLSFTWAYVTTNLPVRTVFFDIASSAGILFIARFSFMLLLCTIFDTRDIRVDKIHGLRSLATDVSRDTLQMIMGINFLIYIAAGFFLRMAFNTTPQVIAFFITGIVVLFVYRLSFKKQGYLYYYFIVDGLMLFSALATYVASI